MYNITMFPKQSGFLLPSGEFFSTEGGGHQNLAYRVLRDYFKVTDDNKLSDPEFVMQDDYSAILIRYRWQERLLYLPKTAPATVDGRHFFEKAIDYYRSEGFKIINLYKISLNTNYFYTVKEFFVEDFEYARKDLMSNCFNYTNTVVQNKNGKYTYNPERIGD